MIAKPPREPENIMTSVHLKPSTWLTDPLKSVAGSLIGPAAMFSVGQHPGITTVNRCGAYFCSESPTHAAKSI